MKKFFKIVRLCLIAFSGLIGFTIFMYLLTEEDDLSWIFEFITFFPVTTMLLSVPSFIYNLKELKFLKVPSKKLNRIPQNHNYGALDQDLIGETESENPKFKISGFLRSSNLIFGTLLILWALVLSGEITGGSDDEIINHTGQYGAPLSEPAPPDADELIFRTLQYSLLLVISGLGIWIIIDDWKLRKS